MMRIAELAQITKLNCARKDRARVGSQFLQTVRLAPTTRNILQATDPKT